MEDKSAAEIPADDAPTVATDDAAGRAVWPHQASALRWLREGFVRNLLASLPQLCADKWHLRLAGAVLSTPGDFISSAEERTCCFAIGSPQGGVGVASGVVGWVEVTPSLAFAIINCLLGGLSGDGFVPRRPLTDIERRLLLPLAEMACAALVASSTPCSCPHLAVMPQPAETCNEGPRQALTASFDFGLGKQAGTLRLSLDQALLPSLASPWSPPARKGSVLEITAVLEESEIDTGEFEGLKAGDILSTNTPVDGEIVVRVAGIPKFIGRLGVSNGRRAVTIIRRINEKT